MQTSIMTTNHLPQSRFFPPAELANRDGLVAVGGQLSPKWLLDAYCQGIFPWPIEEMDDPTLWWSPDPRAILELDQLYISKRLRRVLRSGRFEIRFDHDFAGVIQNCAVGNGREDGTWITPRLMEAYLRLFKLGQAHCVETWQDGKLVGGVYGVAIAGLFAAESKFYRARDASKVALAHLVAHLRRRRYRLMDIQQLTPHMARLGAIEIPRNEYLRRLAKALDVPITFGNAPESNSVFD